MTSPDLVLPDYWLVYIGPVHPTGAGGLFEPHHDEAEGEAEVWDERDGNLGTAAPGKVALRGDEASR